MEFSFLFFYCWVYFYSLFGCLLGFFFSPFFFLFFADAGSTSEAINHKNHIGIANISDIIKATINIVRKNGPKLNNSIRIGPAGNNRSSTNIEFRTATITKYAFM